MKRLLFEIMLIAFAAYLGWRSRSFGDVPEFHLTTNPPAAIIDAAMCFDCKGIYTTSPLVLPGGLWTICGMDIDVGAHIITGHDCVTPQGGQAGRDAGGKVKQCAKCGISFPLMIVPTYFYRDRNNPDGFKYWCKGCTRIQRVGLKEKLSVYGKEWKRQNREKVKLYTKRHETIYRNKYIARRRVNRAVQDGRLVKTLVCQLCWGIGELSGHHSDYTKPEEGKP